MKHFLALLFVATMTFAGATVPVAQAADDAFAKRLAEYMPKLDGWNAPPPIARYQADGAAKGAWASASYRNSDNHTILIRLTDTPPQLHLNAIRNPQVLGAEVVEVKGYKGFLRENPEKTRGSMALLVGNKLAELTWTTGGTREQAMQFAEAMNLKEIAGLR